MIREGDVVELRPGVKHTCPAGRQNNRTAAVRHVGAYGGLIMERDLRGALYWHESDVQRVKLTGRSTVTRRNRAVRST